MALAFESRHNLVGLLSHLLVDVLALLVVAVDVLGFSQSFGEVFVHEQVHTLASVLHASGGVDARSYLEDDVAHGDVSSSQSADVDDGFQSDAWVLVQGFQSVECQYSVLIGHGHNVGCYAHGAEVE